MNAAADEVAALAQAVDLNDPGQVERALRDDIAARFGSQVAVQGLRRCSAGFSWLTFSFDLAPAVAEGTQFILQVGPSTGLFAPYSVRPQVAALASLAGTGVPVPACLWHDDCGGVFGAPFIVSQRLPGDVLLPWSLGHLPPTELRLLMHRFLEMSARLHAVPWRERPIAELDGGVTVHDAARRQVDLWRGHRERASSRSFPVLAWAERWMRANAPAAPRVAVVHGDLRIGNFLRQGARITGLLDWETVHLGDPHEDLAWACLPMFNGGSRKLGGIVGRDEVFAIYEAAGGVPVDRASVRFYEVFGLYKFAVSNLGGAACCEDGRCHDLRLAALGTQVAPMLGQLLRTIEASR